MENQNEENIQMNENNLLSYKEVEELLPDYLFDRLNDEENKKFEASIVNFPDLEKELKDGKELFDKIEQFDYKKLLNDKSQYLPERVVARLEKRNALYQPKLPNYKKVFLFAAMSFVLIIFMFFMNKRENSEIDIAKNEVIEKQEKNENNILSDYEQEIINRENSEVDLSGNIQNNLTKSEEAAAVSYLYDSFDELDLEEYYSELTPEILIDYLNNSPEFHFQSDLSYLMFLDEIENLDEDSFQLIMENFIYEQD